FGVLMLVAATGTAARAQSKPATQPEVVSTPPAGAYASLSQGNKRIATALFEAQNTTANGATPMTLEQIAQEHRSGRKWGDVFRDMKTQGLTQAEPPAPPPGRHARPRPSRSRPARAAPARPPPPTNGSPIRPSAPSTPSVPPNLSPKSPATRNAATAAIEPSTSARPS